MSFKHTPYSFFIRFLLCFFFLYFFFPAYRGVIGPGGKFYSSFLENHFNLVTGLTKFLISSVRVILETAGYEIYQKDYQSLKIAHSQGITVNPTCLGWGVMSFWVAFVFANPGLLRYKMKWMGIGIATIVLLNIIRITLIIIANHLGWTPVTSLDHHQTFNIASYVCIIILAGSYLFIQKKHERIGSAGTQSGHAFTAI